MDKRKDESSPASLIFCAAMLSQCFSSFCTIYHQKLFRESVVFIEIRDFSNGLQVYFISFETKLNLFNNKFFYCIKKHYTF